MSCRTFIANALALMGFVFPASGNAANIEQPFKVKKTAFSIVNALPQCNAPDTTTADGKAACGYANTGVCRLTPEGSGTLILKHVGKSTAGTQDIEFKLALKGLTNECEGAIFFPALSYRRSSEGCASGNACVTQNSNTGITDFTATVGCVVADGKCQATGKLHELRPDQFATGLSSSIQFLGCTIRDASLTLGDALACGLILE